MVSRFDLGQGSYTPPNAGCLRREKGARPSEVSDGYCGAARDALATDCRITAIGQVSRACGACRNLQSCGTADGGARA